MTLTFWLDIAFIVIVLMFLAVTSQQIRKAQELVGIEQGYVPEHQVKRSAYSGPTFNEDRLRFLRLKLENQQRAFRVAFIIELIGIANLVWTVYRHL